MFWICGIWEAYMPTAVRVATTERMLICFSVMVFLSDLHDRVLGGFSDGILFGCRLKQPVYCFAAFILSMNLSNR